MRPHDGGQPPNVLSMCFLGLRVGLLYCDDDRVMADERRQDLESLGKSDLAT